VRSPPSLFARVVADDSGRYTALRTFPPGWLAARLLSDIAARAVPVRVAPGEKAAVVIRVRGSG
jgi:hypothetical protein